MERIQTREELSAKSISTSELKRFLVCRLRWSWASGPPRGLGLSPRVTLPELELGRIVHEAIQLALDEGTDDYADIYWDLVGKEEEGGSFETKIFESYFQKIQEQRALGAKMLEGYSRWVKEADKDIHYLATETQWDQVTLPGTSATLSGVFDALIERPDGLWVLDFKTTSFANVSWTQQDLQATIYVYAARQMYGEDVKGIIFRFMLKKMPMDYNSLILKSGALTQRSGLEKLTDYHHYKEAVAVAALKDLVEYQGYEFPRGFYQLAGGRPPGNWGLDDYALLLHFTRADGWSVREDPAFKAHFRAVGSRHFETLKTLQGSSSTFFWDTVEKRSPLQIENYLNNVIVPTCSEIVNPGKWIGPTGLSISYAACSRCSFKIPCKMAMDGADYQSILEEEFSLSDHYKIEPEEAEE